jgi:hypothetical protein
MTSSEILKELATYCLGDPDIDTLNKISEVASITAMKLKNNLDPIYLKTVDGALEAWSKKEKTPREFRSLFRKERV